MYIYIIYIYIIYIYYIYIYIYILIESSIHPLMGSQNIRITNFQLLRVAAPLPTPPTSATPPGSSPWPWCRCRAWSPWCPWLTRMDVLGIPQDEGEENTERIGKSYMIYTCMKYGEKINQLYIYINAHLTWTWTFCSLTTFWTWIMMDSVLLPQKILLLQRSFRRTTNLSSVK